MAYSKSTIPIWLVHALMLVASALVATSFTVGAAITHGMDPTVLTLIRFCLASFLFLPYIIHSHGLSLPNIKSLCGYAIISGCIVGFFWCMFESLRYTSALNTSALFTLVPGISGIYGMIILRERLGVYRLIALVMGMIGALWIIFRGELTRLINLQYNYGDLLFVAGCFLMAFYTPLVKRFHRHESMAIMTFWILVTGALWLLIISGNKLWVTEWHLVELHVWLGIIYLAIFTTIITFFLSQFATLHIGPTRVMAYSYFYPGFVLIIDWFFGHGLPPISTLPGILIVIAATFVLQSGSKKENNQQSVKNP